MSADLPDQRHADSTAMARVLVTYMPDARAVFSRIKQDFDKPPAIRTIERMRAAYLATMQKPQERPFKPHEGYYPAEASERAKVASNRFLAALERERAISAEWAKAMGALDSPALRQPAIVDRAWDRETELAWRRNDEALR